MLTYARDSIYASIARCSVRAIVSMLTYATEALWHKIVSIVSMLKYATEAIVSMLNYAPEALWHREASLSIYL